MKGSLSDLMTARVDVIEGRKTAKAFFDEYSVQIFHLCDEVMLQRARAEELRQRLKELKDTIMLTTSRALDIVDEVIG